MSELCVRSLDITVMIIFGVAAVNCHLEMIASF